METLRILQRQTVQHLIHTRPLRFHPQQLRTQSSRIGRLAQSTTRPQARSLHTAFRSSARSHNTTNAYRRTVRGYATSTTASTQHVSLSQRLKNMSREYGWSAVGVYLALSALDFPFCFLAVRLLGTDRIGHWEHVVVSTVKEWIKWPLSGSAQQSVDDVADKAKDIVKKTIPVEEAEGHAEKRILEEDETYVVVDHGYREASQANVGADASLWTQLALAYAIHKSFIFIRVPLTAAVLPKVVKTLRSWGYNIGKRPAKKAITPNASSGRASVNTKGSGVKGE